MISAKQDFIALLLAQQVLSFGRFTLKSGRVSPYFFNLGKICQAEALAQVGRYYADTLVQHQLAFDVLFGPAYKGISLATATSLALLNHHQCNTDLCFNRKEAKDHGEGGTLIGAPLQNRRVIIIDDVITAGTAIKSVIPAIEHAGGKLVAITVALDRGEACDDSGQSALQALSAELQLPIEPILSIADIVDYLRVQHDTANLATLLAYLSEYGAASFQHLWQAS